MTLGYIKNKKIRDKMKELNDYIDAAKIKVAHLEPEHFEWLKQELQWPSHVKEFVYNYKNASVIIKNAKEKIK